MCINVPIWRRQQQLLVNLPHRALVLRQRAVNSGERGIAGRGAVGGRQRLWLCVVLHRWLRHDFSALTHTTKQPS